MIALRSLAEQLQKNRQALALAIALVGTLGALGLSTFSLFDTLERKTLDLRFRTAAHAEWADTSIVLIAVDQNSLDFVERQWQMKWPWPREYYGLLLQYLNRAHPRLIAFDYDLSQHDANRLEVDGAESDRAFADAIAVSGNVLLGVNLSIRNWDRDFQTLSFMSYSAVTLSLPVASALMIISTGTKLARLLHRFGDDGYEVKADIPARPEPTGHVHSD